MSARRKTNSKNDDKYLDLIVRAVKVSADYKPRFGQGRGSGLTLRQFQRLYRADPFYSWFGLDSPLMYAAHKTAGGMTSIYRQIGMGCQWVVKALLMDRLGLSDVDSTWSYAVPGSDGKGTRMLTLDGRIPIGAINNHAAKLRVEEWMVKACEALKIDASVRKALHGVVFEVRQGYKSKDAKRQNADVANASNAYANGYLPVNMILSAQIDNDIAERYLRARWLLLYIAS